jgi:hypothetical protein
MTLQHKIVLQAFKTNFELALLCGIIITAADILWLVHDIMQNGWSVWYIGVMCGLSVGLALTVAVMVRHNHLTVNTIKHKLFLKKKVAQIKKIKHLQLVKGV